ncbi:hypothetical protein M0D21_11760 [Aquimarina sp. D1M17]|uniref:hypothetical protein n=1 Tax=Aquimarina acroporae TaxID=2937283 RepID=UPI0020C143FF|nr:hypothetical protein [Aquimarina acroporae]MCK8522250.1 hypothetical protein [Aquimarina acroporae]
MAPLKFEEKAKEELDRRELKPSDSAWERLASQLENNSPQKKGNRMLWYSVAAVFIGVVVLTSVFLKGNSVTDEVHPQFVDRTEDFVEKEDDKDAIKNEKENVEIVGGREETQSQNGINVVAANDVVESEQKDIKKKPVSDQNITTEYNEVDRIVNANVNDIVVNVEAQKVPDTLKQEEVLSVDANMINEKIADVVAQVEQLQKNNTEVSEEEIDKLLRNAQREITSQNILKTNTVSASALLQDVENELDETFKHRVFEALKTGFQKVRTAVAEREN